MLAGVPLSDVVALMRKGISSWSKILEALDYYGISYASKAVYTRGNACQLPACCIVNNNNHFILWYKDSFTDKLSAPMEPDYGYWEERGWHGKKRPWK